MGFPVKQGKCHAVTDICLTSVYWPGNTTPNKAVVCMTLHTHQQAVQKLL
jgi:hypothetical protein